jgi:hypothetical protein
MLIRISNIWLKVLINTFLIPSIRKSSGNIEYSEYIAESLDKNISYLNTLAENVDNSIAYSEYLAESVEGT